MFFSQCATVHAVEFEPGFGGFASRDEVKNAFGWKNALLQSNVTNISFTYETKDSYKVTCTAKKGDEKIVEKSHIISVDMIADVVSSVAIEIGKDGGRYFTGFELAGFKGSELTFGKVPRRLEPCPTNDNLGGIVTQVELVDTLDRLLVNNGTRKVPIWTMDK